MMIFFLKLQRRPCTAVPLNLVDPPAGATVPGLCLMDGNLVFSRLGQCEIEETAYFY